MLGNGDIFSAADALDMVRRTGCDGVVVGRGCLGRPWLFGDLEAAFAGRPLPAAPTLGQVCATMRRHAQLLGQHLGADKGIRDMRKHIAWYLKGFPVGPELRRRFGLVGSLDELDELLAQLDHDGAVPGRRRRPARPAGQPGPGDPARALARRPRRPDRARSPPSSSTPAADAAHRSVARTSLIRSLRRRGHRQSVGWIGGRRTGRAAQAVPTIRSTSAATWGEVGADHGGRGMGRRRRRARRDWSARTPPPPRSWPRRVAGRPPTSTYAPPSGSLHGQHPTDELDRLRRENAEAREQSRRDSLTASYNRRYLDERLASLLGDPASRGADGIAIALVDADHFKQVNDTYGHPFGDRVLRRIVAELDRGLPEAAFCARYGGEEFALVLPGRDLAAALRVCEAARDRIDRYRWSELAPGSVRDGQHRGRAQLGPLADVERLVGAADALLYAAKHSGRNAVAYRDERTGLVRLAGPAGARRDVKQLPRVPRPACDRCGSAP